MNGILRATAQTVPKATIYRVLVLVTLLSAPVALGIAFILGPQWGAVIKYIMWPFIVALVAWLLAGILRLRLVGYLPGQPIDDDFIPPALQPWIRFWLLARFGLLGALLALFLVIIGTALAGWGVNYAVEALVYVTVARLFMDLVFGAAFNFGIITRRSSAS